MSHDVCIIFPLRFATKFFTSEKSHLSETMNNLHETFGEANFDFEIDTLQADMIRAIVSLKVGSSLEYNELTVLQFSTQTCTVMVNVSGQIIEFCPP